MRRVFFLFMLLVCMLPLTVSAQCIKGDCRDGHGTFLFPHDTKYTGEWKNGKKDGKGVETYFDGNTYTGEFRDGKKNGFGVETYSGGNRYEGQWRDGAAQGLGTFILFSLPSALSTAS